MAQLIAERWTVEDPFGALPLVQDAADSRIFDPDHPKAQVDLHTYYGRAQATCGAIGLALGPDLDEFSQALFAPVWSLDLTFSLVLASIWNRQLPVWSNLLEDEPRAHLGLVQESNIRMLES